MKKVFIQGISAALSTFLIVACSNGACCENDVNVLSSVQLKGTLGVGDIQTKKVTVDENISKYPVVVPLLPKAVAHANCKREMINVCLYAMVKFDADSSYDPDGDSQDLSYAWSNLESYKISNEKSFVTKYDKKGFYETTLKVTDEQNLTAIDRVCVLVEMDALDVPLIAKAGEDAEVLLNEKVSLSGRGVCRNDDLTYAWREGEILISTEANFERSFEVGEHTLVLTIKDVEGNSAVDSVVINVKRD